VYDTEALRLLMKQQLIPVRISLSMNLAHKDVTMPMTEVKQIEKDNFRYWEFVGLGVGLAIDAAIIAAISASGGLFGGAK
jgi:hypothetical protein